MNKEGAGPSELDGDCGRTHGDDLLSKTDCRKVTRESLTRPCFPQDLNFTWALTCLSLTLLSSLENTLRASSHPGKP